MMSDCAQIATEIAQPRAGVDYGNTIRIRERNLKAGGVAAELLKASITHWDGAADTVKFQLHTELYGRIGNRGKCRPEKKAGRQKGLSPHFLRKNASKAREVSTTAN